MLENRMLFSKKRKKAGMSALTTCVQCSATDSNHCNTARRKKKRHKIEKEEITLCLFLFVVDMSVYIGKTKESTQKLLELMRVQQTCKIID